MQAWARYRPESLPNSPRDEDEKPQKDRSDLN